MGDLPIDMIWWISAVELPVIGALVMMIWRTRRESEETARHLREMVETRTSQLREALSGFKLEVAKTYASHHDMSDLEARLVGHLLRIEAKLDKTALKTEAIRAETTRLYD